VLPFSARTEHEVLAAAQEIADETGVTVVGVQADVTDTNSLKAAVAHLSGLASFNALNIVVNNAAPPITRADRQIEWTDKEWFAAIDVKTVGALRRDNSLDPARRHRSHNQCGRRLWNCSLEPRASSRH